MIITRNPDALDLPLPLDLSQGTSVTVGNFDGVHLEHQALLAMTCERDGNASRRHDVQPASP